MIFSSTASDSPAWCHIISLDQMIFSPFSLARWAIFSVKNLGLQRLSPMPVSRRGRSCIMQYRIPRRSKYFVHFRSLSRKASLGMEVISKCRLMAHRFSESSVVSGKESEPYWRDVGTVDSYWAANIDLTTVTPSLDLYDTNWSIWTYHAQRPSAKFVFDDEDRRGMAVDSLVSAGCIISGATVRRSLLFTNVHTHS